MDGGYGTEKARWDTLALIRYLLVLMLRCFRVQGGGVGKNEYDLDFKTTAEIRDTSKLLTGGDELIVFYEPGTSTRI